MKHLATVISVMGLIVLSGSVLSLVNQTSFIDSAGAASVLNSSLAQAQAPGWSRGQQNLALSYDECVRRMPAALQAEGFRRDDQPGGNFAVGIKSVHTAVIICSPAPEARMLVQIVVASNGDGGGRERQCLQSQMERPGSGCGGGDTANDAYTTWTWSYGRPGQPMETRGAVLLYANGGAKWTGDGRTGTWSRTGNQITINWPQNNIVDILYLSSDGREMTGKNKDGWNVKGTRQ